MDGVYSTSLTHSITRENSRMTMQMGLGHS